MSDRLKSAFDKIHAEEELKNNTREFLAGKIRRNDKKEAELLENVSSHMEGHQNIHCYMGNSEEVQSAHAHGLSFGKYRAFLELQKLDPTITAEDIQSLSMCRIRELLEELYDSGDAAYDEDGRDVSGHNSRHGKCGRYHERQPDK